MAELHEIAWAFAQGLFGTGLALFFAFSIFFGIGELIVPSLRQARRRREGRSR